MGIDTGDGVMSEEADIGLLDILKGLKQTDLLPALITPSVELHYIPSKNLIIATHNGRIIPREEMQSVINSIQTFYENFSDDAIRLVNEKAKHVATAARFSVDLVTARKSGYILLIKAPDGLYRVGICSNLAKRLKELQTDKLYVVIHSYKCTDMRVEEFHWQKRFAAFRLPGMGEWMKLPQSTVEEFVQYMPIASKDIADPQQDAKRVRMKAYWDHLAATVSTVADNQGAKETQAIKRLMSMIDARPDWEDEHAFACLTFLKLDKKYNGLIGYGAVLSYLPSFMARRNEREKTKAGEGSESTGASRFSDNEMDHV